MPSERAAVPPHNETPTVIARTIARDNLAISTPLPGKPQLLCALRLRSFTTCSPPFGGQSNRQHRENQNAARFRHRRNIRNENAGCAVREIGDKRKLSASVE